jgi:hypothetical protein
MIELILLVLFAFAVIGSLRKPRTFAELEYQTYMQRNNLRFVLFLVLVSLSLLCVDAISGMRMP